MNNQHQHQQPASVGYFSSGLARIRHLNQLVGYSCLPLHLTWSVLKSRTPQDVAIQAVMGWGHKPTAVKARHYAQQHQLPYWALEDGFLRSLGLGIEHAPLHSLILDQTGIYYDASQPSDIENWLREASFSDQELERAAQGRQLLKRYRLSKYNHAPEMRLPMRADRSHLLLVDQTQGDASIALGQASAESFAQMLQAALTDHPEADIWVKVHPDVLTGKKQGYLYDLVRQEQARIKEMESASASASASARQLHLITEDISPWSLFDQVERVYVVTSQLGMEALWAGLEVHCFGLPFYAGWGLTHDTLTCPRRGVKRSLDALFAAAYLRYCRYINPYTGERCEFEQTVQLLSEQRRQQEFTRGAWVLKGFSFWHRQFIGAFLGSAAILGSTEATQKKPPRSLYWASRSITTAADENTSFMEDGFIRSVGLGAELVQPLSLVIDHQGIYYDARTPSDLENLLQHFHFDQALLARAARLRQALVQARLSKYNTGETQPLALRSLLTRPEQRLLLVPGQVETDASIRFGSPRWKTNAELLEQVRLANPNAFIVYKPHPDVHHAGRSGNLPLEAQAYYDCLITEANIIEVLESVDEVHTLTSLTGFEALLRNIPVVTYGLPFYAGWGLTRDHLYCERRQRNLTLDQLVAATLILYPRYVDPVSGDLIDVETTMSLLRQQRQNPPKVSRLLRLKRRFYRSLRQLGWLR